MADALLAIGAVFCGCQANVFLLELITVNSPHTYYALTLAQYALVAALSLPLLLRWKDPEEDTGASSLWPFKLRRTRLIARHKVILALTAWAMSVSNNLVFGLYISVPLHATFRSSSLMLNMLAGYFFLNKRFTWQQVVCALVICGGLVALTMEKSRKQREKAAARVEAAHAATAEEYFWWLCGVLVLIATTACSTALGIFQEYMYSAARKREAERQALTPRPGPTGAEDDAPPMWAEALFFSHSLALPLFALQPARLWTEMCAVRSEDYIHVLLNCLTQFICIAGVYILNHKTSAFTLILTLTIRKLASFTLSVVFFQHYLHFSAVEWVAMAGALMAGASYPFLPKAAAAAPAAVRSARAVSSPATRSRSRSAGRKKKEE